MAKRRRIVLNNDGGTLAGPQMEAPIGVDGLIKSTIGPLVGTHIDTLYWALGTDVGGGGIPTCRFSNVYSHDTKVGQRWGVDQEQFESASNWRIYENTRRLIEEGHDPPKVLIEAGREAGKEVFLSFRVNDCHDGLMPGGGGPRDSEADLPSPPRLNRMKREHPEWLLGPMEGIAFQMHRFAFDFSVPEVRAFKLRLIREACDQYDPDGLDLDFVRHPRYFKPEEVQAHAPLMTDFIRRVRAILDHAGKKRGRRLPLSVRVLPSFDLNRSVGLDVRSWIEERLIDVLVCGSNVGCMQRLPVEQYVDACRNTEIAVLAHIGIAPAWGMRRGLFQRGASYHPSGGYHCFTDAMYRAMAAGYWRAGVDGIYLWNNHLIEYFHDPNWDRTPWREIGDPDRMARMDKHYLVDHDMASHPELGRFARTVCPPAQLPAVLPDSGERKKIRFDIADDLKGASDHKLLAGATLRLHISEMTGMDLLSVTLNGRALDQSSAKAYVDWNEYWLDFDIAGIAEQGWNDLEVGAKKRNPKISAALRLEDVEVLVTYRKEERS